MKPLENKDSLDGVSTLSLWFNLVWSDMTYYCKSSQLSLSPFQGNTTDILHFFVVLLNQCINIIEETILLQYYYLKSRGPLEPDFYIAVEDLRHFFVFFHFCVVVFWTFVLLYFCILHTKYTTPNTKCTPPNMYQISSLFCWISISMIETYFETSQRDTIPASWIKGYLPK